MASAPSTSQTSRPDVVVGIDIGQTCSGVAYSIGPDHNSPRTLNRWPGHFGIEKADKVPTRVGYDKVTNELKNWGFETVFGDDSIYVREQFKLALDADYEDDRPGYTCESAREWYCDYLTCLHSEITRFFDSTLPRWRNMKIEYNFSTPTTWDNPAMIASIEKLIKAAGFENAPNQSVRISLTEAEAAAIEASTVHYSIGDVFMICDAGGGTTDVNMLKVVATDGQIELQPLDHVEGIPIGSTLIDFRVVQHISRRLSMIEEHLQGDIYEIAEHMLMGRFQIIKHSFPTQRVPEFWLDVEGLPGSKSFPDAGIKDSRLLLTHETLQKIFDEQTKQICALMDERILALESQEPTTNVAFIILSGGLGSSPYLEEQLKRRYERGINFRSSNAKQVQIKRVLEPQLAVVRGLVKERTQLLGTSYKDGKQVFETRRCRNSYGTIVRQPYNASQHVGLPTVIAADKSVWVENIVDWLIKRDEVIQVREGVRRQYSATFTETQTTQQRHARIVMSQLPVEKLPRLATDPGCERVVTVDYSVAKQDMKLKKRLFQRFQKKVWRANFDFVVNVGAADLSFQVVGHEGLLSSGNDILSVKFVGSTEPLQVRKKQAPVYSLEPEPTPTDSRGSLTPFASPTPSNSKGPSWPYPETAAGYSTSDVHSDSYATPHVDTSYGPSPEPDISKSAYFIHNSPHLQIGQNGPPGSPTQEDYAWTRPPDSETNGNGGLNGRYA